MELKPQNIVGAGLGSHSGCAPAGTVLDRGIVSPREQDFFLISQAAKLVRDAVSRHRRQLRFTVTSVHCKGTLGPCLDLPASAR